MLVSLLMLFSWCLICVCLLLFVLVLFGVVLFLLVVVLVIWGGDYFDWLLIIKVCVDLVVVYGYFECVVEGVGCLVEGLVVFECLVWILCFLVDCWVEVVVDVLLEV